VNIALTRLPLDEPRWQAFVAGRRDATPLHLPAWTTFLADCYGFESFVLAAESERRVVAGIPVIVAPRPFGKKRWVSLPFSDRCEPLGEVTSEFVADLDQARRDAGVATLELRGRLPNVAGWSAGHVHRLPLAPGIETLTRAYHSSIRQGIRVAAREGVSVRTADRESDLVETFYSLHVRTRRRLGVPVQRRRYFRLLWERLIDPGHGFVLVAEHESTPIAAAVFLRSAGTVLYKYGASDDRSWKLRPNNALFEHAIAQAAAEGADFFDWGRTDFADDGLRRFKANWGSDEEELTYCRLGGGAPRPQGAGGRLSRSVIRRSPAAVSRLAGALLYRYAA
jgi:CelD/BcsL family acetyltransferase involved in cellulose biosynthesis